MSSSTLSNMKLDVQKWFIMLTVSQLIKQNPIDAVWLTNTLRTLSALALYHLVFDETILKIVDKIEKPVKNAIHTVLKVAIVVTLDTLLAGNKLDSKWGMELVYTLVGFGFIEMTVIPMFTKADQSTERTAINELINVATQSSVAQLIAQRSVFDRVWQMKTLATMLGFSAAELFRGYVGVTI